MQGTQYDFLCGGNTKQWTGDFGFGANVFPAIGVPLESAAAGAPARAGKPQRLSGKVKVTSSETSSDNVFGDIDTTSTQHLMNYGTR